MSGEELPSEVGTVVSNWLSRANGDVLEALVLGAQDFLILSASASFGLSRGSVRPDAGAVVKKEKEF